jgi:hypothetical protein
MRRLIALALPLGLLAAPAQAQHWNDSGPGRDLLSSTITEFDSFRQRTPGAPAFGASAPAGMAQQARPPIPILDWAPPPQRVTTQAPRRRAAAPPRQTVRRSPAPAMRDPAPLPASASMPAARSDGWEQSLTDRERELDRLRRILEEDRLRYQQARQPQLR